MNDAYRAKLERYLASMLQAKRMLEMGILTPEDYAHIDTIIAKKHGMYHVEQTHDPIIEIPTFLAVQAEKEQRAKRFVKNKSPKTKYPFTGKLVCAGCGKNYRRKTTAGGIVWICSTFNTEGKAACASKQIPEETLLQVTAEVMGMKTFSEKLFGMKVASILVGDANTLTYRFYDGTETVCTWKDRSRRQSWTEEMKEEARKKALERRNQYA